MKTRHLKTSLLLPTLLLLASGCAETPAPDEAFKIQQDSLDAKVIYGEDNRLENYQASAKFQSLAKSTVALIKKSSVVLQAAGEYQIVGKNFGSSRNLCSTEPFREQTSAAFCSGSLVAPDVVMTAGHCIRSITDCESTQFVFDFQVNADGKEVKSVSKDKVYSCASIIHTELTSNGADFALIKLDRKVAGRSPLKLRTTGEAKIDDNLVVIGHPVGLPQKIAGGAKVRSIRPAHFVANLDTYGGNSGSAVFNADTGAVEGILVRGETDFKSQGSCNVSFTCADNNCRGEDVTKVSEVLEYLDLASEEPPVQSPQEEVFTASASNVAIPDNSLTGIESKISTGASKPQGRKVLVKIDIAHTWRGDLSVELVAPSGKKVVLHNRTGGSLDHLTGVYGADLAAFENLAALSSEAAGVWTLKVSDRARADLGVLKSWSLVFK